MAPSRHWYSLLQEGWAQLPQWSTNGLLAKLLRNVTNHITELSSGFSANLVFHCYGLPSCASEDQGPRIIILHVHSVKPLTSLALRVELLPGIKKLFSYPVLFPSLFLIKFFHCMYHILYCTCFIIVISSLPPTSLLRWRGTAY